MVIVFLFKLAVGRSQQANNCLLCQSIFIELQFPPACFRRKKLLIHTAIRGLCDLNVNICCFWAFAETTNSFVFLWRTVLTETPGDCKAIQYRHDAINTSFLKHNVVVRDFNRQTWLEGCRSAWQKTMWQTTG